MTYFKDLSEYTYGDLAFARPGTKNIGWLGRGHDFPVKKPSEEVLDLLWEFCSISVALARGGHDCEFCSSKPTYFVERNGQRLLLGVAEMRAFSDNQLIYAAPTLIFHYVRDHHYQPPGEFLDALRKGPRPPSQEYFEALKEIGLPWSKTSSGADRRYPPGDKS
jgi:hypothetical protein